MERGNFATEFICGNVGGICGIAVVYPFDTAKIRMQVNPTYKNAASVFREMIRAD
jgi:hypothetical protein